jgi:hypothetical protein
MATARGRFAFGTSEKDAIAKIKAMAGDAQYNVRKLDKPQHAIVEKRA